MSDFDFSSIETIIEGADYASKVMVVVHDTGGMFGVDSCASCTHYDLGSGVSGEPRSLTNTNLQ